MFRNLGVKAWILLGLFILCTVFLLIPDSRIGYSNQAPGDERFDPSLSSFNDFSSFRKFIDDKYASSNKGQFDTITYVELVSEIMKERFMFGMSEYSMGENWIASLSGKLLWQHFAAKVEPDAILHGNIGLCSQQTIIFMEILRKKGISVRSVGWGFKEGPGHFLCEVKYNGVWHMYDVTKEPNWHMIVDQHRSMDYFLQHKDSLYRVYEGRMNMNELKWITEKVEYGEPDKFPAATMLLFHKLTHYLTYILPVVFLFLFYMTYRKRKIN